MSKLNSSELFVVITGTLTTLYAVFLFGKMAVGADVSLGETQLMAGLTLVNCVNLFHWTAAK